VPGYSQYPLVDKAGDLAIVAHKQYAQTDDPVFELIDGRRVAAYWVRVIPTPRQAAVLLEEQGGLPRKSAVTPTNPSDQIWPENPRRTFLATRLDEYFTAAVARAPAL
jgi:hypothetical protein